MTERINDLAPLFKHLGQKQGEYQELSRDADAHAASERWPLLRNIPLQARTNVPVLSNEQRHERLGNEKQTGEEIELPVAKAKAQLGSALNRLGDLRRTEVVRASAAPVERVKQVQEEEEIRSDSSVFHKANTTPENLNHRHFDPSEGTKPHPALRSNRPEPERSGSGLFGKKAVAAPAPTEEARFEPEKKNSGIFGSKLSRNQAKQVKVHAEPERKGSGLFNKNSRPAQVTQAEPEAGKLGGLWGRVEDSGRASTTRDAGVKPVSGSRLGGLFGKRKIL